MLLNILKCFAYPIITADGERFGIEKLPDIMKVHLLKIMKDASIIVEDYSDISFRNRNVQLKIVSLTYTTAPKDTAEKIAESKVLKELKCCIAVIDFFLAAKKLAEKKNTEYGIAFLSATVELGKAWKFIDEGAKGTFKNFVLSNTKSVFDIAINIFKIKTLVSEGDHEAAGFAGGMIAIKIASLVCAGLYITSGPVPLILFLAGVLLEILIKAYTREDIEKWVKFSCYGKDFQDIGYCEWRL